MDARVDRMVDVDKYDPAILLRQRADGRQRLIESLRKQGVVRVDSGKREDRVCRPYGRGMAAQGFREGAHHRVGRHIQVEGLRHFVFTGPAAIYDAVVLWTDIRDDHGLVGMGWHDQAGKGSQHSLENRLGSALDIAESF